MVSATAVCTDTAAQQSSLCGEGSLNCSSQTALIICRYGGLGYGAGTLFQGGCLYFAEDIAFKIGGADGTAVYLTFQGGSLYL